MLNNIIQKPATFADDISSYVNNWDGKAHDNNILNNIRSIINQLPTLRRLNWNENVLSLIGQTYILSAEEVCAHIAHASFPFDDFWIEGPTCLNPQIHYTKVKRGEQIFVAENYVPRIGLLVRANQKERSFKFKLIEEKFMPINELEGILNLKHLVNSQGSFANCQFGNYISVSEKGIYLDDEQLLRTLAIAEEEKEERKIHRIKTNISVLDTPLEEYINAYYTAGDFLARLFLILGNKNFANNLIDIQSPEKALEDEKQKKHRQKILRDNTSRKNRGQPTHALPPLKTHQIKINISEDAQIELSSKQEKKIRLLLGWTDVRRSREITNWRGTRYFRGPHERRIATAEDRRTTNSQRNIVGSPLEIS